MLSLSNSDNVIVSKKSQIVDMNSDINKHSDFKIIQELGEGANGKVVLIQSSEGKEYAAKIMKYGIEDGDLVIGRDNSLADYNFSLIMDNPYIIKSHELIIGDKYMFLIMEKADQDLASLLEKRKFSPIEKKQNIFKLASALDYIHQSGFIHCDLKSVNTLVKNDSLLIADFGLVKLLDDASSDTCQTFNYRSPEAISTEYILKRYRYTYGDKYIKWSKNPQASEIWSFGILCLDIMYNSPNISLEDRINDSPFSQDVRDYKNPYMCFINTLAKLDDPHYNLRQKGETVYSLVVSMLGNVSEINQPLLKLICNKLLIFDQEQRIIGFKEFINNELFLNHGLKIATIDYYQYPRIKNMYTPSDIIKISHLKILFEWMVEVSDEFQLYPIIVMNAIDYIIQHHHIKELVSSIHDLQMFAVCIMWIIQNIYNYRITYTTLSEYVYISNKSFTIENASDMIIRILRYEHGLLKFESLYFQLPSEQLLQKAIYIMVDPSSYISYETPHNLAMALIRDESSSELARRRTKAYRKFRFDPKPRDFVIPKPYGSLV